MSSSLITIRPARPDDEEAALDVENAVWAPFHWEADGAPEWDYDPDLWVVAEQDGTIVASADGCRVRWDGDPAHLPAGGWSQVIADSPSAAGSRWACALGTSVLPHLRGQGLAARMLEALGERARDCEMSGMLAPARPSSRALMADLPIQAYAAVRLPDGRHFDPWLRTHERIGGRIIGVCERSMAVQAPVPDWERWLGFPLPHSGRLLVPGAIGWLEILDGQGVLSEDSVWVLHGDTPSWASARTSS